MTEFDKKGYVVVRKALAKTTAKFLYNYLILKREVCKFLMFNNYPHMTFETYGGFEGEGDMIPDTYSAYADIAMETLLLATKPIVEKTLKMRLYPNYSYARLYKKGDILKRHKDRFSCEISTTMNLGGDAWDIYVEPSGKTNQKGVKVSLKPGDMLVYRGCELEHWRKKFKGKVCGQVFLHYNNKNTAGSKENMFDKRIHLGLPDWFQR